MNRRLTFRDACAQLGISGEDVYVDNNGKEEDLVEVENALLQRQTDGEDDTAVDDEGGVEVFVEGKSDSSDDEEEPVNHKSDDEQDGFGLPEGPTYPWHSLYSNYFFAVLPSERPQKGSTQPL